MVSRKSGAGSQGDKQSAIVQQFLEETGGSSSTSSAPSMGQAASAHVVSSAGFVPRTRETEAEKQKARDWDRSALLQVKDDDAQVKIYHAYAANANTNLESGVSTKRGLGMGDASGGVASVGRGRMVAFVSAGSAPVSAPVSAPAPAPAPVLAPAHNLASASSSHLPTASWSLPTGWSMGRDPATGTPYFANPATGATQWHPPPGSAQLPAGWETATDPSSGRTYYCNATTGQTQWTPPVPAGAPSFTLATAQASGAAALVEPPGHSVRVRGVPASMAEADVKELFASCGCILRVVMDRSAYSAVVHPKTAHVYFDAPASADAAVKACASPPHLTAHPSPPISSQTGDDAHRDRACALLLFWQDGRSQDARQYPFRRAAHERQGA
jgi:hypothetical protein